MHARLATHHPNIKALRPLSIDRKAHPTPRCSINNGLRVFRPVAISFESPSPVAAHSPSPCSTPIQSLSPSQPAAPDLHHPSPSPTRTQTHKQHTAGTRTRSHRARPFLKGGTCAPRSRTRTTRSPCCLRRPRWRRPPLGRRRCPPSTSPSCTGTARSGGPMCTRPPRPLTGSSCRVVDCSCLCPPTRPL